MQRFSNHVIVKGKENLGIVVNFSLLLFLRFVLLRIQVDEIKCKDNYSEQVH